MSVDNRTLCASCIGDPYLSKFVADNGSLGHCSYCAKTDTLTLPIVEIAKKIQGAIFDHYEPTQYTSIPTLEQLEIDRTHPDYVDSFFGEPKEILNIIIEESQIASFPANDIREAINERAWQDFYLPGKLHYPKHYQAGEWQDIWDEFERSIKTEARYYLGRHLEILNTLFGDVYNCLTKSGKYAILEAGPSGQVEYLYRARCFQSDIDVENAFLQPDLSFGPPPRGKASAGRMNARGISVFYGASKEKTAIYELRPPVRSTVVVAKFKIVNSLKLLNLSNLAQMLVPKTSIFDPEYISILQRAELLKKLVRHLARPIMPDEADIDYIPTQALAEYFANHLNLDGLIFPSAQCPPERNVVIFYGASKVRPLKRCPLGTEIKGWYWDSVIDKKYDKYQVLLTRPRRSKLNQANDSDNRTPNLEIILEKINLHSVDGVVYECTPWKVEYDKRDVRFFRGR